MKQSNESIAGLLQELKRGVESATKRGDFLLSVNQISHSWIYIHDLWRGSIDRTIRDILKVVCMNLQAKYEPFTAYSTANFTHTSEEEMPMFPIVNQVVEALDKESIRTLRMARKGNQSIEADGELLPDNYVGFFVLSIHIDLIKQIIEYLTQRRCRVLSVVAILERDTVSRQRLSEWGVELIPLIVRDESGTLKTVLEADEPPYKDLHGYFDVAD